jgi:3-hydroxyisobutyrate dehydrogenase-like beta-hydroxyacid dehydrogenase
MAGATGASGFAVDVGGADQRLVIRLSKDAGATGAIDFIAGDYDSAGIGKLSVTVSDTSKEVILLEGSRFRNMSTGDVYIDCGVTGTIEAYKLP